MTSYVGEYGTYYSGNLSKAQKQENALYIYRFLTAAGWTIEAICGLLGNIEKECDMDPGCVYGSAYGLTQWTPGSKYLEWAETLGYIEPSMDGQLSRITWELQNPKLGDQYYSTDEYPLTSAEFRVSTQSADTLARAFALNYERSAAMLAGGEKAEKSLSARGEAATAWYTWLTGIIQEGDTMTDNKKYGYWVDSGTIDTMPTDKCVVLFNQDLDETDEIVMKHIGAYDCNTKTEIQAGGYGGIITVDGVKHSTVHKQPFNAAHWSHWAALPDDTDWSVILAFMRAQLGEWYEFGGAGPDEWDCSGLLQQALKAAGYSWYHGATTIWKRGFEGTEQEDEQSGTPTLRYGSYGEWVKTLQGLLNQYGAALEVDGKFGKLTRAAVKAYQSLHNLTVDGVVGPKTWGALTAEIQPEEPAEQLYTLTYVETLVGRTYAEAQEILKRHPDATMVEQK